MGPSSEAPGQNYQFGSIGMLRAQFRFRFSFGYVATGIIEIRENGEIVESLDCVDTPEIGEIGETVCGLS